MIKSPMFVGMFTILIGLSWGVPFLWAQDTNLVSQILRNYGGFEQAELEGWQAADARVPVSISTNNPYEGKQSAEVHVPPLEKPVYYSPGVLINPHWRWDCRQPATLRFFVNAQQRYLGYNLYAKLVGKSNTGELFTFVFFAMQTGRQWTYCRDKVNVWNPSLEFVKGISGFEVFAKHPPQLYCSWLPGLSAGENLVSTNQWVCFDASLNAAFSAKDAPARPQYINFEELAIRGYIYDRTHYRVDAVSLGDQPEHDRTTER